LGIDYVIEIFRNATGTLFGCTATGCETVLGASPTWSFDADNSTLEISETLANLNITSNRTIQVVFYYDNDSNFDDNIPDSGSLPWEIPGPTAITLASLTARSGNVYAVPLLVGSLLLLAALLLVVRRARSRVA
jgi:hypothetical protein